MMVCKVRLWALLLCYGVWLLAGCAWNATPPEVYINAATAIALTPTAIPTPPPPTPLPTATPIPTATPTRTPVPTLTPAPTATPVPTSTPNPALAGIGYCQTRFGPDDEARFAARLVAIEATRLPLVDQLTLVFSDTLGVLHGSAACIQAEQWETLGGDAGGALPEAPMLSVALEHWAHDELWLQSPVTQTRVLTEGLSFVDVRFTADPLASRGTTIGIGLRRVLPFRVRLEADPTRIVVEVDRGAQVAAADDPLGQAAGQLDSPSASMFFLQNDDVWRFADGRADPVTTTTELETALAVSPDGETLAVCRAPAETDPANLPYNVRASLWVMSASGGEERLLADVGGCADLSFAPSGKTVAFTVNTAAAPPAVLSVWTVAVVVGEPRPATPLADEWDRFGAAWLPDSRLVYRATHQAGISVLFVRDTDGAEREVSARLLTGPRYSGIGEFVVGPDLVAVEALRSDGAGADVALLRFDGTEVAVEQRGFWQRPLAFLPDGLLYLSAECAADVVQHYTLLRRRPNGAVEELLGGRSVGGVGEALPAGNNFLLVQYHMPQPGLRGPRASATIGPSGLWLVSGNGTRRRELYRPPVPIAAVGTPRQ